jgi:hypothetical protein
MIQARLFNRHDEQDLAHLTFPITS